MKHLLAIIMVAFSLSALAADPAPAAATEKPMKLAKKKKDKPAAAKPAKADPKSNSKNKDTKK
jgi:hypothetical protein